MMEIKGDRSYIISLIISSILLWILTRNSPEIYDAFQFPLQFWQKITGDHSKQAVSSHPQEFSPIRSKHSIILDSFKTVKYFSKLSKDSDSDSLILPPFNIWKEVELTRQGRVEQRDKNQDKYKSPRRKLNYASAKCGAKILASNKEAKFRTAILSEKVDQYMLNPCNAKTWFIVELCDTIEATQIELVNYELYSSSPQKFSTFWSDVYPTQTWHHLGTFEAKDKRTMQSFDLDTRNLGKFIKVTISSHYGKEHYCPLSILRILGYSMVYEYDEIEIQNEEHENNKAGANESLPEKKTVQDDEKNNTIVPEGKLEERGQNGVIPVTHEFNSRPLAFMFKACELEQKYCSDFDSPPLGEICLNQPSCLFLRQAIPFLEKKSDCRKICRRKSFGVCNFPNSFPTKTFVSALQTPHVPLNTNSRPSGDFNSSDNSNSTFGNEKVQEISPLNNITEGSKIETNASASGVKLHEIKLTLSSQEINGPEFREEGNPIKLSELPDGKSNLMENDYTSFPGHKNMPKDVISPDDDKQCDCRKDLKSLEGAGFFVNGEDSADSAALIQKESVLIKLTTRLRTAERNLNLINRYLQQLSELYRQQMEDMQSMFNGTVKALRIASEKASAIDRQQQISIENLECKMSTLNIKVDLLTQGREDIWKRVLELHGIFIIMEIIIMLTIISICVNKSKKNKFFDY